MELSEGYEKGSLRYSLDGAGASRSGEIELIISRTWETPGGVTFGGGLGGQLGTWSAAGCPLGTTRLQVDPSAIEAMLDDLSFSGVGDDG